MKIQQKLHWYDQICESSLKFNNQCNNIIIHLKQETKESIHIHSSCLLILIFVVAIKLHDKSYQWYTDIGLLSI